MIGIECIEQFFVVAGGDQAVIELAPQRSYAFVFERFSLLHHLPSIDCQIFAVLASKQAIQTAHSPLELNPATYQRDH
ncbi:hypothetical protein D3C80_1197490 [compost metagenome]